MFSYGTEELENKSGDEMCCGDQSPAAVNMSAVPPTHPAHAHASSPRSPPQYLHSSSIGIVRRLFLLWQWQFISPVVPGFPLLFHPVSLTIQAVV